MGIVARCRKLKRTSETLYRRTPQENMLTNCMRTYSPVVTLWTIGLRYFNVFGPRQDPNGAYGAIIPKWIAAMVRNEIVFVNVDGETSRDFCYIENVTQANVLAAITSIPGAVNQVYNVGVNTRTSLNQLFLLLYESLKPFYTHLESFTPTYSLFGQEMSAIRKPTSARPLVS